MKLPIVSTTNTSKGSIPLPAQFEEPIREDLIKRAVLALQSKRRQSYGNHPEAGMRQAAKISRRRRDYKGAYGMGISRVPRKTLSRNGTRMNWVGAVAPGTVKGRQAHPPKSSKQWAQKINSKENKKAIRSAMAATMNKTLVQQRGHHTPDPYPFAIDASTEQLQETQEVINTLHALGFKPELQRGNTPRTIAGKGKNRGRKTHYPSSVLIVVSAPCKLQIAARNVPGVTITPVTSLNAELLAPGGQPGRITLFTQTALERITKDHLYT